MENSYKLSLIAIIATLNANMANAESVINLEEIDVTQTINDSTKIFKQKGAVSTKEDLYKSGKNLDTIIREIPGAFTQQDKSSGLLSLNIRGSSGFGRANSMVDGVVQTFYATSVGGKGRSTGGSQSGAPLDPNFIAGVDVTRGSFSSQGGMNALDGSANFRTIGVNDVVKNGQDFGLLLKGLSGTNATNYDYMTTGAYKSELDNGGYIGFLYGYSQKIISQNYKAGGGTRIANIADNYLQEKKNKYFQANGYWDKKAQDDFFKYGGDFAKRYGSTPKEALQNYLQEEWRDGELPQINITPVDPQQLIQRIKSHLFKVEYVDDNNALTLQYRSLKNSVGGRKSENRTYQFNYNFIKGDMVDFNILMARNQGIQKYSPGSAYVNKTILSYLRTDNIADTIDINNAFSFDTNTGLSTKHRLGINTLINEYKKNRHPDELGIFYKYEKGLWKPHIDNLIIALPKRANNFQPSGKQKFYTFYLDNSFEYDILNFDYNLNYVKYNFTGNYIEYIDLDIEPDAKKSGKKHALNHSLSLSLDLHPLFTPFITYSKTYRMPNIQEMFFSQIGDSGVNTDLKPERAYTYQIGFNSYQNGLFTNNDTFGFKIVRYKTDIKDYIHNVFAIPDKYAKFNPKTKRYEYYIPLPGGIKNIVHHQNYDRTVKKRGIEIELSYDSGGFYTNLSYSRQLSNQPTNFSDTSPDNQSPFVPHLLEQTSNLTKITTLPKDYARLDMGARWLNEKLTIGATVRYYGQSKRATIKKLENIKDISNGQKKVYYTKELETIKRQPLINDFYIVYEPIKDLSIRFEVQNAFDRKYIDPLDSGNDSANQHFYTMEDGDQTVLNNYARGRTMLLSFNYKF